MLFLLGSPTWTTLCPSQGREIQHHIDAIDLPVSLVDPGRSPRVVGAALPKFPVENSPRCWFTTPTKNGCQQNVGMMYSRHMFKEFTRNHTHPKRGPSLQTVPRRNCSYQYTVSYSISQKMVPNRVYAAMNCSPHQPWRNLKHHFPKRRKHHEVYSM